MLGDGDVSGQGSVICRPQHTVIYVVLVNVLPISSHKRTNAMQVMC